MTSKRADHRRRNKKLRLAHCHPMDTVRGINPLRDRSQGLMCRFAAPDSSRGVQQGVAHENALPRGVALAQRCLHLTG